MVCIRGQIGVFGFSVVLEMMLSKVTPVFADYEARRRNLGGSESNPPVATRSPPRYLSFSPKSDSPLLCRFSALSRYFFEQGIQREESSAKHNFGGCWIKGFVDNMTVLI